MTKWVLAAVVTFAASGVAAQDAPNVAAAKECSAAAGKNDVNAIMTNCQKAAELNADWPGASYYLAYAYQSQKNWSKVVSEYQTFLKKAEGDSAVTDEQRSIANRAIAFALAEQDNHSQAIPWLQKVLAQDPKDAAAHYRIATAYLRTKNSAKAEEHFARVTQLEPKSPGAFYQAGRLAYIRKDADAAKKYLSAFLGLSPTGATATQVHFLLGRLAADAGDNETAAQHFEQYMAGNPKPGAQTDAVKKFLDDMKAAQG